MKVMRMNEKRFKRWAKTRRKGRTNFIWIRGVLIFGALTTFLNLFLWSNDVSPLFAIILMIMGCVGGYLWGVWTWELLEKQYFKYLGEYFRETKADKSMEINMEHFKETKPGETRGAIINTEYPEEPKLDKSGEVVMNTKQKVILVAVMVVVIAMLLFPPYHHGYSNVGYSWIFKPPEDSKYATVNVPMLLAQWVGVLIAGGIGFFIAKDS